MYVRDASHLTPAEAARRLQYLQAKIHVEQFQKQFFIRYTDTIQYIRSELAAYWQGIIDDFHGFTDIVGQIVSPIVNAVQDVFEWVWQNVMQPAIDAMLAPIKWILDGIDGVVSWIRDAVSGVWNTLKGVWDTLRSAWDSIVSTVSGAFEAVTHALTGLGEWIVSGLQTAVSFLGDVLQGFWNWLVNTVKNTFTAVADAVVSGFQTLMSGVSNAITGILEAVGEMTPDRFQNVGLTMLTVSGLAAGGLLGMTAVWDILHPFKDVIPDTVKAMLYDVTNFKLILGGLAGAAIGAAITIPGRYFFNSILTPRLPSENDAQQMVWRGAMGVNEYDLILRYHGFGGRYRTAYQNVLWNMPGIREALDWRLRGIIDDDTCLYLLQCNGVDPSVRQHYIDGSYRLLGDRDVLAAFWRGIFSEDEAKNELKKAGYPEYARDVIIRAGYRVPTVDDAMRMYWRGLIDAGTWDYVLAANGIDPQFFQAFTGLLEAIPSPSDLVRFVVREVGLMPPDYPTPQFFIDAMKKWGYSDYWSRAYWWSHWELPAFTQLQEAYYRGLINESEFSKYVQWHDYAPEPRPGISKSDVEIMMQLIWQLPGKLEARFMRRWGIIDQQEHEALLRSGGMHPDWLKRVALAERMNMLQDERSEVKSVLRSMLSVGMLTPDVYSQWLREVFYTPEEIEMSRRAADLRWQYELFKASIDAAVYSYRVGKITLNELADRLYSTGMPAEKVQARVMIEEARAIEARRETYAESVYIYGRDVVIGRYADGMITPEEFENEMRLLGYSDPQIQHLRIVAELKRDAEYAKDVLNAVLYAFRHNKIDVARAVELLQAYGFMPDYIEMRLALENLKKGIGVGE